MAEEKPKRSALERALYTLGVGGFGGALGYVTAPKGYSPGQKARHVAGVGGSNFAQQLGAEIGGSIGDDSMRSRALGGAIGGAAGGAGEAILNPQSQLLYKFLVQRGLLSPKAAPMAILGARALTGSLGGALQGAFTTPGKRSKDE